MLIFNQANFTVKRIVAHYACGALSVFKLELGHKGAERAFRFNTSALAGEKFVATQCLFSCHLPAGSVGRRVFCIRRPLNYPKWRVRGSSAHVQYSRVVLFFPYYAFLRLYSRVASLIVSILRAINAYAVREIIGLVKNTVY